MTAALRYDVGVVELIFVLTEMTKHYHVLQKPLYAYDID